MTCSNCALNLSCACQKRTASNGASVCANCLTSYEEGLQLLTRQRTVSANRATAR